MIADHMRKLFAYNSWAWQHVFASVTQLDPSDYHATRHLFGDSSIHKILVHAMAAESIWLARIQGESPTALFDPAAYAGFTAVYTHWRDIIHNWANYVQWLSNTDCKKDIAYQNTSGTAFTLRLSDLMQHVINHATEHRSQLTPMLFQLGVPTPPLDYMRFQLKL